MVRAGQATVKSVAVLAGLAVVAGYLGALHPAGDSLAVFRVPLTILAALALIWSEWPTGIVVAGAAIIISSNALVVWRENRLGRIGSARIRAKL